MTFDLRPSPLYSVQSLDRVPLSDVMCGCKSSLVHSEQRADVLVILLVQERGVRSGTLPAPLAVGFGAAAALAQREMAADDTHIRKLAHRLYDGITGQMDGVVLNGPADLDGKQRYIGNLNLSFAYVEGESLLMGLKVRLSSLGCCFLMSTRYV